MCGGCTVSPSSGIGSFVMVLVLDIVRSLRPIQPYRVSWALRESPKYQSRVAVVHFASPACCVILHWFGSSIELPHPRPGTRGRRGV
eukprot:IDg18397t1